MSKRILLIDDDQVTNFFNQKLITQTTASIEVKAVTSVSDAIIFLRMNKDKWIPDFIFLDIFMPVKNGWDFLEEFQMEFNSLSSSIKLFMLSSSVYAEDVNKAKNHYLVNDYISKPLSEKFLNEILN